MLVLTAVAHAATKVLVQMLDTTGSTNGQVIVLPGPSGRLRGVAFQLACWHPRSLSGPCCFCPRASEAILQGKRRLFDQEPRGRGDRCHDHDSQQ